MGQPKNVAVAKRGQDKCSTPINASQEAWAILPPTPQASKKMGRPKGSKNKSTFERELQLAPKVKRTFTRMVADALPLMAPISEDGGGTLETSPVVSRESLERRVSRRLNVLDRYLTDQRLTDLLAESKLKEIGIFEGIFLDKALVLKGQPTVIIGSEERVKLNEVMPALLQELRRRNLITTISERKIEFKGLGGNHEEVSR
mgnify:CR=1 FL=1